MQVFVAAWIGSNNLGDELIFRSLIRKLHAVGVDDVIVPSRDPASTAAIHGVRAIDDLNPAAVLGAVGRSDTVIFGGGGLVQDSTSLWNLPYHYSRLFAAKIARRRFGVIGVGAGPLHRAASRWLTRQALRGHSGLTVRDEHSADLLRHIGVDNVEVSADLVFSMPPPDVPKDEVIAVCLRPVSPVAAGISPASRWSLAGLHDWIDHAARNLDVVSKNTQLTIRFVAFDRVRDHALHVEIANRMKSSRLQLVCPGLDDVWEVVGRSTAVVGMRFHACVVGLLCGRPVLGIGYDPKVNALRMRWNNSLEIVPNSASGLSEMPEQLNKLLQNNTDGRNSLAAMVAAERRNDEALRRLLLA